MVWHIGRKVFLNLSETGPSSCDQQSHSLPATTLHTCHALQASSHHATLVTNISLMSVRMSGKCGNTLNLSDALCSLADWCAIVVIVFHPAYMLQCCSFQKPLWHSGKPSRLLSFTAWLCIAACGLGQDIVTRSTGSLSQLISNGATNCS